MERIDSTLGFIQERELVKAGMFTCVCMISLLSNMLEYRRASKFRVRANVFSIVAIFWSICMLLFYVKS